MNNLEIKQIGQLIALAETMQGISQTNNGLAITITFDPDFRTKWYVAISDRHGNIWEDDNNDFLAAFTTAFNLAVISNQHQDL